MMRYIVVLVFFSFCASAQYDDKLVFKDGRELLGRTWVTGKSKYVVLKTSKKAKKVKYDRSLIHSRERKDKKTKETCIVYFKKIQGTKDILAVRKLIAGKVEGFILDVTITSASGHTARFEDYCIGKQDDDFVTKVNYGPKFKKFQKIIDYYFSDCQEVVSKIKNLEFGGEADAIPGIIEYYNENCSY